MVSNLTRDWSRRRSTVGEWTAALTSLTLIAMSKGLQSSVTSVRRASEWPAELG
jgi:hypothetical protein